MRRPLDIFIDKFIEYLDHEFTPLDAAITARGYMQQVEDQHAKMMDKLEDQC